MKNNHTRIVKTIIASALALGMLPMLSACGSDELDVAEEFLNALYEGDGKKVAKLSSETFIERTGAKTEKLFIKKIEDMSESLTESYKDKYGKKWKYEIEIIDSYDYEAEEYYMSQYASDEVKIVEAEIRHEGGGLFNDKEGSESIKVYVENIDGDWLVASMSGMS